MSDYPEPLQPWQEKVLKQFIGKGTIQLTGRHSGKSWYNNIVMQQFMDDLTEPPITNLHCDIGTVFGKRYYTVEPFGGSWFRMEAWSSDNFGPSSSLWHHMEAGEPGRWYMNDRKFYFRDEADRDWFLLKWTGWRSNDDK